MSTTPSSQSTPGGPGLTDPEDAKLVTLARATRARTGAAEGACVRDLDGRTYAAASVALTSLQVSAVQMAVAMAINSGAKGLEAVLVLGDDAVVAEGDLSVVREFAGGEVPVHLAAPDGTVVVSVTS
jgi:cytidine deaminase